MAKTRFCALALALAAVAPPSCTLDERALVPPTVDEDRSLPAVDVNGTRLHLEQFGDPGKPLVVFLHGGPGCDYRSMLPLRSIVDDGYQALFFDHRGAGLSRRHACGELTGDNYIHDLEALVDRYAGTQPIAFVGHSWGAMYATWYVDRHPDRVKAVILGEPGAFTRAELDDYLSRAMAVSLFAEAFKDAAAGRRLLTPDDHARADFLMFTSSAILDEKTGMDPDQPEPKWRFGAAVQSCLIKDAGDFDWTKNLPRYTGRALFIHGERNQLHTLALQETLAAHYPSARVVTFAGVGHDMFYEKKDETLAYLRAELKAAFAGATP